MATGSLVQIAATTVGYTNNYSSNSGPTCSFWSGGDRVYSVSLMPNARVVAIASSNFGDASLSLVLGSAAQCEVMPRVCAAWDDDVSFDDVNFVRYLNTTSMTQQGFLIVDGFGSSPFDLNVLVNTPPAGDACEAPISLSTGMTRTGEALVGFADDYRRTSATTGSGCSGLIGVDRAYSVLVGAGELLTVNVTPSAGLDVAINLHDAAEDCLARVCATSRNALGSGGTETLTWRNTASTSVTAFIVVEGAGSGTFSIETLTGTPVGDTCGTTAAPITSASTLANQSLAGYSVDYSGSTTNGCESATGPDRVYVVTVPPGQRLYVDTTPTSSLNTVVNLISGTAASCAGRMCAGSGNQRTSGGADFAFWDNATTSPQNIYAIVSGFSSFSSSGTFSLDVSFLTGDFCTTPLVVSGPYPRTYTALPFAGYRKDLQSPGACATYSGAERVFEVTIPPGQSATVDATSSADLVLNGFDTRTTCSSSTCAIGVDRNASGTESVVINNPGTSPLTATFSVGLFSSSATGATVTLRVDVR